MADRIIRQSNVYSQKNVRGVGMKYKSIMILVTAAAVQLGIGSLSYITEGKGFQGAVPLIIRLLLVVSLCVPVLYALRRHRTGFGVGILCSLVICGAGDLLITFGIVMAGAGCFLVVHAVNAGNFVRRFYDAGATLGVKEFVSGIVIFSAGFCVYSLMFFHQLSEDTSMQVMVFFYAVILSYALWKSFILYKAGSCAFWFAAFIGEFLFFLTDIQVAYSELVLHHQTNEWVNNTIYYSGLYLLALTPLLNEERESH